jgi:DNA-binding CsgD family transcriptional regulator
MLDPELAPLVGDIYDAAIEPSRWSRVLEKTARFAGGMNASLFSKDPGSGGGMVYFDAGSMEDYRKLYFGTYAPLDPLTTGHVLAEIDRPICTADIMDYGEFQDTRIYRELAQPYGIADCGIAVLDKSSTGAALFGVFRDLRQGRIDAKARSRMRQLAPHVRRALMICRTIEARSAEAASLADTMDGLRAGLFLVDPGGRIVHANASARAMTEDGATLRASAGRLTAADAKTSRALDETLYAASQGDAAVGRKGIALPLPGRDGNRYAAHVLPLTAGERRRAAAYHGAIAAVFVHETAVEGTSPAELIAKHYGLTPSELRVLLAVVQAGSVQDTADALGISRATVKTHLHRVFGKTGASRQVDLVRLVAAFANPLVS